MSEHEPLVSQCPACGRSFEVPYKDRFRVLKCPHCKRRIELVLGESFLQDLRQRWRIWRLEKAAGGREARGPRPVSFQCRSCGLTIEVDYQLRRQTIKCPECAEQVGPDRLEVLWAEVHELLRGVRLNCEASFKVVWTALRQHWRAWWPKLRGRSRKAWTNVKALRQRRRQRRKVRRDQKRRRLLAVQQQRLRQRQIRDEVKRRQALATEQQWRDLWAGISRRCKTTWADVKRRVGHEMQLEAHRRAVLAGEVFDCDFLVEELKNDWVAFQKLGLTRSRIGLGVKVASPLPVLEALRRGAPPWLAALLGFGTYLASGPAARAYVELKCQGYRAKWARIIANCSRAQLLELAKALQARYPFVYDESSVRLLPPHR